MKKYLILLLMGILPYLSLAQNKVENSYLSITVPPGWHVQKQDMPGTKMELLNFFNDGPILYNMGIIVTRVRDKDCVKNRVKRAKIVRFTLC